MNYKLQSLFPLSTEGFFSFPVIPSFPPFRVQKLHVNFNILSPFSNFFEIDPVGGLGGLCVSNRRTSGG